MIRTPLSLSFFLTTMLQLVLIPLCLKPITVLSVGSPTLSKLHCIQPEIKSPCSRVSPPLLPTIMQLTDIRSWNTGFVHSILFYNPHCNPERQAYFHFIFNHSVLLIRCMSSWSTTQLLNFLVQSRNTSNLFSHSHGILQRFHGIPRGFVSEQLQRIQLSEEDVQSLRGRQAVLTVKQNRHKLMASAVFDRQSYPVLQRIFILSWYNPVNLFGTSEDSWKNFP